jgi:biopolymer transport protein ExbD
MVDLLTVLLVFLLRSWSTEAAPAAPEPGFTLPVASSEAARRGGLEIVVSPEAVYLSGERIAATARATDSPVLRPLYDRVLALRDRARAEVYVDARVPWNALRTVLATAKAAGVDEVSLVAELR